MARTYIPRESDKRNVVKSHTQNIDNGAGATVDFVLLNHPRRVKLHYARIVYTTEQTGTVAAGNVKLGVAVNGATVAAATAFGNTKAVGTYTDITLLLTEIDANTPIIARHTGIATTAAGEYFIELEYSELD